MTTARIVGRDRELAELDAALEHLADARGPAVVELSGEAGIGKTRLLDELCERAGTRGARILRGRAAEFEQRVPFAPVVEALDPYLATLDADRRLLPEGELRHELSAIFPALRTAGAAVAGVHDERHRAYRAVRELLERLAGPRPLVVAIDDLHWADDASTELISALLQKPPAAPVLIAVAARAGPVATALRPALAAAERRAGTRRLRLGPLDEAQAGELLGPQVGAALRRSLYETGGGNPFYLEQLARTASLDDAPRPGARTASPLGVPPAISEALDVELDRLSAPVRMIAQVAAVVGEPFEPDLVAAVAGVGEAAIHDALDALMAAELVKPAGVPRRFAFRHPLVRRAVYEGSPAGWRLGAHARAAGILAARGAPAVERAHHVEHSAGAGDEAAIAVLRKAAEAVAPRTPAAAAAWLRAALRLIPGGPPFEERREILVLLASALRGSGDLAACRETLRDALDLTPPGDVLDRARLEAACATVESWLGRADDAYRRLVRARAAVPSDGSAEALHLDVRLALEALNRLEFGEGIRTAASALRGARALGDGLLIAEVAAALALAYGLAGRVPEAHAHRRLAREALDGLSDSRLAERLDIFFYLAWAENYIEEHEHAIATAERGLELSRRSGQGHLLVPLMLARALPLDTLGRLAESVAAGEEAIEAARSSPNPQYLFWALWECGYSHALAGNLERSIALFEESVAASRGLAPNFLFWAQPGSCYGYALVQNGEPERGVKMSLDAVGGPEAPLMAPYERILAQVQLSLALVTLGRLDEAAGLVKRAERLAVELGLPGCTSLAAEGRANLLLAEGRPAQAQRVAAVARESAEARGHRFDAAHLLRLESLAAAELGERDAAVAGLRRAELEFDSFPSVRARDQVRRDLRRLGARSEPRAAGGRGPGGLQALSARELEVAELVADRHMNKQIAAKLFLSEKTVESHMRSIFRKLSVSSRTAVAETIARQRNGS